MTTMMILWAGLAHAGETDCVTKDGAWRWLSTATADRWVHGSSVVVEQASGATGRLVWKPDEATRVAFSSKQEAGQTIETFKWDVELSSTDGKPISADVADPKVKLTLHCQRTSGGAAPAPAATAKTAVPAKAEKATPAPAPEPAKK